MVFVVFFEHNHKEDEIFITYLQWEDNEDELTKLYQIVKNSDHNKLSGDFSNFKMNISTFISQSAADEHLKLENFNSYHKLFDICYGNFKLPNEFDDVDDLDNYDLAILLDKYFYGCNIKNFFN